MLANNCRQLRSSLFASGLCNMPKEISAKYLEGFFLFAETAVVTWMLLFMYLVYSESEKILSSEKGGRQWDAGERYGPSKFVLF